MASKVRECCEQMGEGRGLSAPVGRLAWGIDSTPKQMGVHTLALSEKCGRNLH